MRTAIIILMAFLFVPLIYGITYTINPVGGDYPSFTAAIDYLNNLTSIPAGGIEFLVPSNLTFTELPDTLIVSASQADPIVFHKSGTGANPIIYNDTCPDTRGVIMMVNCAWITFDGIDLADPIITDANKYAFGYVVESGTHITIKNNHVRDFANMGIYARLASTYITIYNNKVTHSADFTSSVTTIYGINVQYNSLADQITIERNIVSGLKMATSTLYGIRLGQVNGKIINNFVSLTTDNNDVIYGIRADSRTGKTIDVDFNTVLISGTATDNGYALATFGGDGSSTFNIRNNIFLNNRTGFNQYCVYLALISPVYVMDYNVYYSANQTNNFFGRWFQTDVTSFPSWQQTSGFDLHSKLKNLTFVNPTLGDLHLSGTAIGDFDLSGTPIAAIQNDIDNDTRLAAHPYRGADENLLVPLDIEITFMPSVLDFGIVPLGQASNLSLTIANTGSLPISVDTLTTLAPFQLRFANGTWSQFLPGFPLTPDETRVVEIMYTPVSPSVNNGFFHVVTNVPGSEVNNIPLNGTGGAPEIDVNPLNINFGNNLAGQPSSPVALNIHNLGNLVLHLSAVNCPPSFEIRYPSTGNWTNLLTNIDIAAGLPIIIEVRFYPSQVMTYTGTLTISSDDADESNVSVNLSGEGVDISPPLNLVGTPGNQQVSLTWDAPFLPVRDERPLSTYRIYRNDIQLVETTNNAYTDNSVVNNTAYTYYVTAIYTNPDGESASSNSVTVTPFNPIPVISVSADSLSFGRVPRNSSSNAHTFFIQNQGWVDLQVLSIVSSAPFYISTDGLAWNTQLNGFVLTPGSQTIIHSRFSPIAINNFTGAITINSNDASNPATLVDLYGTSTGIALTMTDIPFNDSYLSEAAWGDYDNDNDLDLLLTGYFLSGSGTFIYRNEGNNTFTQINPNITPVGNAMANWVDFDRDGDLDIFISGQYIINNHFAGLYRNDNGTFTLVTTGIVPLVSGSSEWGDYDNDGDPDLLMTGDELVIDGEDIAHTDIIRNDGNGAFTVLNPGITPISYSDAKFCDWDNDGDLDIAITGRQETWIYITKIYRNDGILPFVQVYQAPLGLRYSDLVWGDYDNDGDADLLVTGSNDLEADSFTRIYRNDGNSVFTETDPGTFGIRQGDIVWTDLDNDGLLDIFMNGIRNNQQWIGYGYLDIDGAYAYADSVESLKYANMVPGDYDNDGDIDFFQSGRYDFQDYRCNILRNDFPFPQTPPGPPSGLSVVTDSSLVIFNWNPGTDLETPVLGLTYNLYVGHSTTTDEHYTANANIATGFRRLAAQGNMGQKTSFSMILPDGNYYWGVQTIDNSLKGSAFAQGPLFSISGVGSDDNFSPSLVTELSSVFPNPFNPETSIKYNLRQSGPVLLEIFNLKGQLVKTIVNGVRAAGSHTAIWNGTCNDNSPVTSGIYFCCFKSGAVKTVKKISLVK